jgi:hypothetical protein
VERFENRRNVMKFRRFSCGTSSRVEYELKTIQLRGWKIKEKRVAIVKARMNKRCGNGFSCLKIKCIAYATKITNVKKQDSEMAEMCSDMDKEESKTTPRFRADDTGKIERLDDICRAGSDSLDSCLGRPMRRNSVLEWLSESILEDIQSETLEIVS